MAKKEEPKAYHKVSTYIDFVHYCLRKLGGGAINIPLTEEQIQDRITDALQYYREIHLESTRMAHYAYQITNRDKRQGFVQVSPEVIDIVNIQASKSITAGMDASGLLENVDLIFWNNFWGTGGSYTIGTGTNTSMTFYEMTMQQLELMQKVLNAAVEYSWRPRSNQLFLYEQMVPGNKIIISAYKMVDPETDGEIWDSLWLKEYATALLGVQYATNLSKFGNVPTSGGVTIDADGLLQRYTQEKETLEQKLYDKFEEPILGFFA